MSVARVSAAAGADLFEVVEVACCDDPIAGVDWGAAPCAPTSASPLDRVWERGWPYWLLRHVAASQLLRQRWLVAGAARVWPAPTTSASAEPSSIATLWTPAPAPAKALVEVAKATVSLTPASTMRGKLVAATAPSVS